jgi:hypothetical protein
MAMNKRSGGGKMKYAGAEIHFAPQIHSASQIILVLRYRASVAKSF